MPASASASVATFTTRLSTVSASNLPNGVCAHPTMLAVMVVLPVLVRTILYPIGKNTSRRFQRFHRLRAHGGYAGPVAGADIRRRPKPGAADRQHIRLGQQ